MVGETKDPSNPKAVAASVFGAVVVYAVRFFLALFYLLLDVSILCLHLLDWLEIYRVVSSILYTIRYYYRNREPRLKTQQLTLHRENKNRSSSSFAPSKPSSIPERANEARYR